MDPFLLPPFILRFLQEITISRHFPAFLKLSATGLLMDYGGDTRRFGIIDPPSDTPVGEIAGCLEGLFPLKISPTLLPRVEVTPGVFADLHLVEENKDFAWVLFLDKTRDEEEMRSLVQRCNELLLQEKPFGKPTPGSVGIDILKRLGFAVFERTGQDRFAVVGELPAWFQDFFTTKFQKRFTDSGGPFLKGWGRRPLFVNGLKKPGAFSGRGRPLIDPGGDFSPAGCFPFLETFLANEATKAWERRDNQPALSDLWIEDGPQGIEYYFEAAALSIDEKKILLIQMVNPDSRENYSHIQKGREKSLAYEKALKTEKMLRSFLANMSHELRTPMNAILGISKMLHKYYNENLTPDQMEGLRFIFESGERLLTLINQLLDLSKIEAGKMRVDREPLGIGAFLASIEKTVIPLLKGKSIAFKIKTAAEVPPRIVTDGEKVRQVLLNLLGNAVKFTQQGEIRLTLYSREQRLFFEVQDTGIGISETHLPYIFDIFTQVDGSASREYGGTGLGLALCKKLAALLQGEITVQSVLGQGSVFTFFIPLVEFNESTVV